MFSDKKRIRKEIANYSRITRSRSFQLKQQSRYQHPVHSKCRARQQDPS